MSMTMCLCCVNYHHIQFTYLNQKMTSHDKFCYETGYGPLACMNCQTYAKVRADERMKIAEKIRERYIDQPLKLEEWRTFMVCEQIAEEG